MKKLLTLAVLSLFCSQALALSVIVHPSNAASLDQRAISKIFLGKLKEFPNGNKAVPISLSEGNKTQQAFVENVLKKSPNQLTAYWSKLLFTGKGQPPKQVGGDAEMIALIAANPNMIGFIEGAGDSSVKVIGSF